MKAKYLTPFLSCVFFLLGSWAYADLQIQQMAGTVEFRAQKDGAWQSASRGTNIPSGGAVRTNSDGRVTLLFPNRSRIWLKESSGLEVQEQNPLMNKLSLLWGSLKAKVPHLRRREQFQVGTPIGVAAVRGTEFTITSSEKGGDFKIHCLFGKVNFDFTFPSDKGTGSETVVIPQGMGFQGDAHNGQLGLLDKTQEIEALSNWDPGLTAGQRFEDLKDKEVARQEVRQFADRVDDAEEAVKDVLNRVKEEDFAAGRTLKDIHGNLVRVDQRLLRPDSSSLQFVNLVKRPVYDYTAHKFAYSGAQGGSRLDSLQARVDFNRALPEDIADWPGFFEGESVKPKSAELIMANHTSGASGIFEVAYFSRYDATSDRLVDDDKLYAGVVSFADMRDKTKLAEFTKVPTDLRNSLEESGKDSGQLFSYHAEPYLLTALNGQAANLTDATLNGKHWFAQENFLINNDGQIRNISDFTNTGENPFDLLADTAGEVNMFVKRDASLGCASGAIRCVFSDVSATDTFTGGRNIDLVLIPDLGVAIVQRLLSTAQDINFDHN
ncbi:MAG: FecR domain-containing protein [Elusimicrobia bacterium]|nr:FecR domain-containing protein [Elusimicrobiota bacterium]